MKLAAHFDRAVNAARGRPARVLVLLWAIAAVPWLAFARTIPYDAKDEFYPGVAFTVKSLLRGEAPFWNPYLYSGYPSFADPQAMTFSPSVVLPMLVSQSIVWFDIVILLHVLLGGLGILRLGRSYDWKDASSLVAALVFMFGGVAVSQGCRPALGIGGRLATGAGMALLVAAPQLIATLNVLPYTNRGQYELARVTANSLSAEAFLTLLSPNILGNLWGRYWTVVRR